MYSNDKILNFPAIHSIYIYIYHVFISWDDLSDICSLLWHFSVLCCNDPVVHYSIFVAPQKLENIFFMTAGYEINFFTLTFVTKDVCCPECVLTVKIFLLQFQSRKTTKLFQLHIIFKILNQQFLILLQSCFSLLYLRILRAILQIHHINKTNMTLNISFSLG